MHERGILQMIGAGDLRRKSERGQNKRKGGKTTPRMTELSSWGSRPQREREIFSYFFLLGNCMFYVHTSTSDR